MMVTQERQWARETLEAWFLMISQEGTKLSESFFETEKVTDVNEWTAQAGPYDNLASTFTLEVPEHFNMAAATVGRHAMGIRHDHTALVCEDSENNQPRRFTYSQLYRESLRMASFFHRQGVGPGDVVVCYTSQGWEAALTHLACYILGAVVAPLSLLYGRDTLRHAISDSRARFLVTNRRAWDALPDFRDELPSLRTVWVAGGASSEEVPLEAYSNEIPLAHPHLTRSDDPALLLYTSGSTGLPKGILHAHRLVLGYLASVSLFYQLHMRESGQVLWTPSDWSWIAGIVNVQMTGWYFGHTVVAGQGKVTPEWIFDFVERNGVTHTFLTPTALKRMASWEDPRLRWKNLRLRSIGTGGEPCPGSVLEWSQKKLGVPINEFYGLTEVNHLIGNCQALFEVRPGSMGKPYPGHQVQIIDDDGRPVAPGVCGQIVAHRSDPTLFLGYWNQPERTSAMFHGDWVMTGDFAHRDEDGYFWYEGRRDDLIKSAGYRIGPAEVEDSLISHPAVEEAAVIGIPDSERGQVIKAFIRLAPGIKKTVQLKASLQEHVKTNLAVYKYPRVIEFVDSFPLTSTGKISRKDLRSREYQ